VAALLAALVVAALSAASGQAAAQDDLEAEQEELQEQEAANAADVDALTADASDVEAAITALDESVARQSARLDDAKRAVDAVHKELAAAEAAREAAEADAAARREELRDVVLDAYVRPPSDDLAAALGDDDPTASAKRKVMAEAQTRSAADVIDQLRAAEESARRAGVRAEAALAQAEQAELAEEASLDALQTARGEQQALADDVHARLDAALSEAAAISGRSQELADQITARETALAAKVSARSGSGSRPSWTSSGVTVTTVRGIEVSVEIADDLDAMMAAAEADGVYLSGSGYRDIQTQIYLREQHCGSSEYAIWEMPSGDCSPPVARPGYSMHERGLAVDFVVGDDLIRSRGTNAFGWLRDHAAEYGFYNLPSEPWHWSTTGS
jgi:hypothetical protein